MVKVKCIPKVLLCLLNYDHISGAFSWKKNGKPAGCLENGYLRIRFNYSHYMAHRIAWAIVWGTDPKGFIDHINGERSDNRLSNLRVVDMNTNNSNRAVHRSGKLSGCSLRKDRGTWRATITRAGKRQELGCYPTELEAHTVYLRELKEITNAKCCKTNL